MISVRIGSVGASPRTVSLASGSTVADALSEGGFSSGVVVKRRGARVDASTTVNDGDLLVVIGESKTSGAASKEALEREVEALRAALAEQQKGDVLEVPTPEFIRTDGGCCTNTIIAERGSTVLDFILSQISCEEKVIRITDEEGNELSPFEDLEERKYIVTLK